MGERILREEGFEVWSVADEPTAVARLEVANPDLVIADVFLPGGGGLDLCRHIKNLHRHVRVILTAGQLEPLDEEEARRAGYLVMPEGPSCTQTLWLHDLPAIGLPSASTWKPKWADELASSIATLSPDSTLWRLAPE